MTTPIDVMHALSSLSEDRLGPDAILWWGGWGGVLCGWHRPQCLTAAHTSDLQDEVRTGYNPTEEDIADYHETLVGIGMWPRTSHDLEEGERVEEYDIPCDECLLTPRESLTAHLSPAPAPLGAETSATSCRECRGPATFVVSYTGTSTVDEIVQDDGSLGWKVSQDEVDGMHFSSVECDECGAITLAELHETLMELMKRARAVTIPAVDVRINVHVPAGMSAKQRDVFLRRTLAVGRLMGWPVGQMTNYYVESSERIIDPLTGWVAGTIEARLTPPWRTAGL
jgi:hypothetical protein